MRDTTTIPGRAYDYLAQSNIDHDLTIKWSAEFAWIGEAINRLLDDRHLDLPVIEETGVFSYEDKDYLIDKGPHKILSLLIYRGGSALVLDIATEAEVQESTVLQYKKYLSRKFTEFGLPFEVSTRGGRLFLKKF